MGLLRLMRAAATSTITQPSDCRFLCLITWFTDVFPAIDHNRPTPGSLYSLSFVIDMGERCGCVVRFEFISAETLMLIVRAFLPGV